MAVNWSPDYQSDKTPPVETTANAYIYGPEWKRRALEAEAEVERLRSEINRLHRFIYAALGSLQTAVAPEYITVPWPASKTQEAE